MTDYKKYINALRKCAKEHENDRTSTGHIIVSDLCRDTANLLESLEQESITSTSSVTHKIAEFLSNWDGDETAKMEISVDDMREIVSAYSKKARLEHQLKETVEQIKEYEDRSKKTDDEIHVGDEVYSDDGIHRCVVLSILNSSKVFVLSSNGFTGLFTREKIRKTGRNYPVEEILKKLNESEG